MTIASDAGLLDKEPHFRSKVRSDAVTAICGRNGVKT
jgi:hypothetical protein